MPILFDTSILVDLLRGSEEAKDLIKKVETGELSGIISSMTEAELMSGEECRNRQRKRVVEKTISLFSKIDVDNEIAEKAGEFRRDYGTPLVDSIIAATAFFRKAKVWTRDLEHFKKIRVIEAGEPY